MDRGFIVDAEEIHPVFRILIAENFVDGFGHPAADDLFLFVCGLAFHAAVAQGEELMDTDNETTAIFAHMGKLSGTCSSNQCFSPGQRAISPMISRASLMAWLTVQ